MGNFIRSISIYMSQAIFFHFFRFNKYPKGIGLFKNVLNCAIFFAINSRY